MSTSKDTQTVCPESTIESATRRNFIRKAALTTVAAGVGGVFLGKTLVIPESSASSNCTSVDCYFDARYGVSVDTCNHNSGSLFYVCGVFNQSPSLTFGNCFGGCTGEGIASNRASGGANYLGLDLYTAKTKRISITNSGNVGIGTCSPSHPLHLPTGKELRIEAGTGANDNANYFSFGGSGTFGIDGRCLANGRFVVNNAGNVGIGQPSPTAKLDVDGTVHANSCGISFTGPGVFGHACVGIGVSGSSSGTGPCAIGVFGQSSSQGVPIVANGASCQTANLQQWKKGCTVKSIVNSCGWLAVGGNNAITTLHVNGSMSAKVASPAGSYKMSKTDFTVLAKGSGSTITLPAANTAAGMMVYIKNVSSGAVSVAPHNSDHIEGVAGNKTLSNLGTANSGMMLISDGSSNWYVLSNATT